MYNKDSSCVARVNVYARKIIFYLFLLDIFKAYCAAQEEIQVYTE